jgi:hypothetical protein
MRDEGTPAALAPARGLARRRQWPSRSSAALWFASVARHRSLACSADICLHQGTAIVTRCPPPAHPVGRCRHCAQTAPAALRYWNKPDREITILWRDIARPARLCPERRTPARKPRFSTYSGVVCVRHGLSAGGTRIRTLGPALVWAFTRSNVDVRSGRRMRLEEKEFEGVRKKPKCCTRFSLPRCARS